MSRYLLPLVSGGSLFPGFGFPEQQLQITYFHLPSNQFRLGDVLSYIFIVRTDGPLNVRMAYVSLQAKEFEWIEEDYDDDNIHATKHYKRYMHLHFRDRQVIAQDFILRPEEPFTLDGDLYIPKDKGWTIPEYLEWEIEVGIVHRYPIRTTFPISVWPIQVERGVSRGGSQ